MWFGSIKSKLNIEHSPQTKSRHHDQTLDDIFLNPEFESSFTFQLLASTHRHKKRSEHVGIAGSDERYDVQLQL